jgi:hypothetical protein
MSNEEKPIMDKDTEPPVIGGVSSRIAIGVMDINDADTGEIAALVACIRALQPLSGAARGRVLRWAGSRFGTSNECWVMSDE